MKFADTLNKGFVCSFAFFIKKKGGDIMPKGDGTGPQGQGPKSGGSGGGCNPQKSGGGGGGGSGQRQGKGQKSGGKRNKGQGSGAKTGN